MEWRERWEKGFLGGMGFVGGPLIREGGDIRERGSRDKALKKWQSEDQSWLRNPKVEKQLTKDLSVI